MATKTDDEVRTYQITTNSERFRVTVPSDWKVTFGPVAPGVRGSGDLALRFWEQENKQRAIFRNVVSFRDLSIPFSREVISKSGSSAWESSEEGSSNFESVKVTKDWSEDD